MPQNHTNTFDDMLFNMLKECKTLPSFLDQIFGFLHRRTDFYHVSTDPDSPIGLPEGLSERLVKHTFFKWKQQNEDEKVELQENEVPSAIVEVVLPEEISREISNEIETVNIDEEISIATPDASSSKHTSTKNSIFTNSESYNGAIHENYCWSQNIQDVDITLKIPENVSTKNIEVNISTNKISVKIKDQIMLEGELCQKCKHKDAVWSLDKGRLQIHIDKCREMWWDCLLTTEDRMDLTKIDCSRPFEELPEEAQAKIEELGWNQERKRLGLPTSDELAKQELLKQAWNAEGSPFSGPFDPSQVIFH